MNFKSSSILFTGAFIYKIFSQRSEFALLMNRSFNFEEVQFRILFLSSSVLFKKPLPPQTSQRVSLIVIVLALVYMLVLCMVGGKGCHSVFSYEQITNFPTPFIEKIILSL